MRHSFTQNRGRFFQHTNSFGLTCACDMVLIAKIFNSIRSIIPDS
nr:MAG TPA: hypothetical protein [Caudoviricetes sp.]